MLTFTNRKEFFMKKITVKSGPKLISPLTKYPFRDVRKKRRQENALIVIFFIAVFLIGCILVAGLCIEQS